MRERLACVVRYGIHARLGWIRGNLRPRQPQGVLHKWRLHGVGDNGQLRSIAEAGAGLRIEEIALRVRMHPVAIGLEVRGVDDIVDRTIVSRRLHGVSLRVEGTVLRRCANQITRLGILGKYRDDTARGVAVQRGERAAQHFDVVGAA